MTPGELSIFDAWQQSEQNLYAVFDAGLDNKTTQTFFQLDAREPYNRLFAETPLTDSRAPSPYLIQFPTSDSRFLALWRDNPQSIHGWFGLSDRPFKEVTNYLRSIIKIKALDGAEMLFGFWKKHALGNWLSALEQDPRNKLMGPFAHISWYQQHTWQHLSKKESAPSLPQGWKQSPWFQVTQPLLDQLPFTTEMFTQAMLPECWREYGTRMQQIASPKDQLFAWSEAGLAQGITQAKALYLFVEACLLSDQDIATQAWQTGKEAHLASIISSAQGDSDAGT